MNNVDKEKFMRTEYWKYLCYCQDNVKEPQKTYVDWSGEEILSYDDWKIKNAESIELRIAQSRIKYE